MIASLIATGTILPGSYLLFGIVVLITAAGNAINDYFDAEIDAINRPDRPIPSGSVSRKTAWNLSLLLFVSGIVLASQANPICLGLSILNSAMLYAYAAKFKRLPLAGNLSVAYLVASMFIFGGAITGWAGIIYTVPITVITFFAMLGRELLKAAEDVEGDRKGGADTLPVRIGIQPVVRMACVSTFLAVVSSVIPFLWWGWWYLAGILLVDVTLIAAVLKTWQCTDPQCIKKTGATIWIKAGAFASLLVFALSAVFL
jgi:geranylgeranylglycerol-phosphate geranylgeranyltransferase